MDRAPRHESFAQFEARLRTIGRTLSNATRLAARVRLGQLVRSTLEVLHELHDRRVLHTDLNRDNLLAFGRGGELRAFLIDLGAATVVERWPDSRANPNCLFAAGLIHGWLRELFARSEVRAFRPFLSALRAASHVSVELLAQFDALSPSFRTLLRWQPM